MTHKSLGILAGFFLLSAVPSYAQNAYGLPAEIKDGNILHCFNWKLSDIKAELPNIAEAGFVAVQTSPMQRNVSANWNWSDPYRPADFAFSVSGLGTESQLKDLCAEAEKYGIKVIVDVVFNHVDNGQYHATWWNSNGRLRSTTNKINYSNRYSITHDCLGDYPEVNTESTEVIARAKQYIEQLKSFGVSGIRFDAAKHIGLPSEDGDFWKEVTSVPGMFYYGEILGTPGGSNSTELLKEYATYMSVTDESYSNTARNTEGVPAQPGQWSLSTISEDRCVYWGESHDTYANEGGASKNMSQERIDRAYAILACRKGGTGLYLSRPSGKAFGDIRVGQKGSTHFKDKPVAEVNKFKNAMAGKADSYSKDASSTASSVTRQGGGAVIVRKGGAGQVSVPNGNGYCPEGKYYDRVSGYEFTVTSTTITGYVGPSGIAVIYGDYVPGEKPEDPGISDPEDDLYIYNTNTRGWDEVYIYMYTSGGATYTNGFWPGEKMTYNPATNLWSYKVPTDLHLNSKVIFSNGKNTDQYPADVQGQESGFDFNGKSMISDGDKWSESNVDAGIGDIEDDFDEETASWFNLQGLRVNRPTEKGIYIMVSAKGKTKKVMIR